MGAVFIFMDDFLPYPACPSLFYFSVFIVECDFRFAFYSSRNQNHRPPPGLLISLAAFIEPTPILNSMRLLPSRVTPPIMNECQCRRRSFYPEIDCENGRRAGLAINGIDLQERLDASTRRAVFQLTAE